MVAPAVKVRWRGAPRCHRAATKPQRCGASGPPTGDRPLADPPEDNGPVADFFARAAAHISGDSYVMLLIIGTAAVVILALVLFVMK